MLKSTYHHRILSLMNNEKTQKEVQRAYLNDEVLLDEKYPGIIFITSKCTDVPVFSHPLRTHQSIAIDVRTITKLDVEGALVIRSRDEFEFLVLRAQLELAWIDEDKQMYFTTISATASKFYSSYIADTLTRLHTLSPDKASIVHIAAAYFFWCQLRPRIEDVTDHEVSLLKYIRNATGLPHDYIIPVLQDAFSVRKTSLSSLEEFIALLEHLPTLENALSGLSVRTLNTATMYSWRGGHASEVVSLSLEYPPCFIAMLIAANGYRAFKHTPLEQLISRHRKVDMDAYTRSVKAIIKE